jgi:uncharacterized protein (TIGR03435 family)
MNWRDRLRAAAPLTLSGLVAAVVALFGPVAAAAATVAQDLPRFEVASIRPNASVDVPAADTPSPDGLAYVNLPVMEVVMRAYGVRAFQIDGMPGWAREARYDITAKAAGPITDEQRRLMLRSLLADRFHMKVRLEKREQTTYVLTRRRPDALGPGLKPRADCGGTNKPCEAAGTGARAAGYIRGQAFPMSQVERMLSIMLNQVVLDETKIDGVFDVDLSWRGEKAEPDDSRPSLFTAVEEQLGLRLTPQRRAVDMVVIESIERPAAQ